MAGSNGLFWVKKSYSISYYRNLKTGEFGKKKLLKISSLIRCCAGELDQDGAGLRLGLQLQDAGDQPNA